MGLGSALLALVSTASAQAGFHRFSPGACGLLSSPARCCLLPFWALPPLCAPAQGGGHGATGLRGQVRCDTSLLCCCGLYLHSDALFSERLRLRIPLVGLRRRGCLDFWLGTGVKPAAWLLGCHSVSTGWLGFRFEAQRTVERTKETEDNG